MYAPCGIGIFGTVSALELGIVLMFSETAEIPLLPMLVIPVISGIAYNRKGKELFLKRAGGNRRKAEEYAKNTDIVAFLISLAAIAVIYNIYES